jgi:hypothetical protein
LCFGVTLYWIANSSLLSVFSSHGSQKRPKPFLLFLSQMERKTKREVLCRFVNSSFRQMPKVLFYVTKYSFKLTGQLAYLCHFLITKLVSSFCSYWLIFPHHRWFFVGRKKGENTNCKLARRQVNKMSHWQKDMLPKWQIDKMANWHNGTLTRLHVAKVKNRQNGK